MTVSQVLAVLLLMAIFYHSELSIQDCTQSLKLLSQTDWKNLPSLSLKLSKIIYNYTPQNTTQWKETNHSSHSSSELIQEHTSPAASETSWQNGQPRGTKGCPSRTCPHGRTESNSSGGMGEQRAGLLFRTQELQAALQKFLQVPRTSPERPNPLVNR